MYMALGNCSFLPLQLGLRGKLTCPFLILLYDSHDLLTEAMKRIVALGRFGSHPESVW